MLEDKTLRKPDDLLQIIRNLLNQLRLCDCTVHYSGEHITVDIQGKWLTLPSIIYKKYTYSLKETKINGQVLLFVKQILIL